MQIAKVNPASQKVNFSLD